MTLLMGKLVRLAPIDRADIPAFLSWFQNYELQRLLALEVAMPLTQDAEDAWYEEAATSKNAYHFSIRELAGDKLIGNCALFGLSPKNRSAELGIAIGETDYWGKGYGSDALRVLLGFAFGELNLWRVQLEVIEFNRRAIRAYEKLGFSREGVRRQAIYREGAHHGVILMALLADEWRAMGE